MNNNSFNNWLFLKELLAQTYSVNNLYSTKETSNESIKIIISEEELKEGLMWNRLLEKCPNLSQLRLWFDNFKRPSETYPLSYYIPGYFSDYINIKIHESDLFHLIVHFKLSKKLTNTFNLSIIFSFWFERPQDLNGLNLDYINSLYRDLIVGYKIETKLQNLGYSQISLFNIDSYNPDYSRVENITNPWVKNKPLFFNSYSLGLLNANPFKLIDDLIENLNEIDVLIKSSLESDMKKPEQFFFNFSSELKNFLFKGRELFQVAKDSLEFISQPEKEITKEIDITETGKKERRDLTPEILISIFEQSYEKDKEKGIPPEDCGFRSLSEIHKEFGEQYPFSKQTYYNCLYSSQLEVILEKRQRNKKGGGLEYRLSKKKEISGIEELNLDEIFMKEKMLIEKALVHYNKSEITVSINIFEDVLKSPSIHLQNDKTLYLGSKYYLGKCYYNIKKYQEALKLFKEIHDDNENLIEVNEDMTKIYSILHDYEKLTILLDVNIKKIEKIFKKYDIEYSNEIRGAKSLGDFDKIKEGDDLTSYALFLNSTEIDKHFKNPNSIFRNQTLNFYTKNRIASTKLIGLFIYFLNQWIELRRRKIFRLVLEGDLNKVKESIDGFVTFLENETYRNPLDKYDVLSYLHYFKQLVKSYFKDYDFEDFNSKVDNLFPGFSSHAYPFNIPYQKDSYKSEALGFINEINMLRYQLYELNEAPLIHMNEKIEFNEIEFVLEYIYTEAFFTWKNDLIAELINQLKHKINSNEFALNIDVDDLYQSWEMMFSSWSVYNRPKKLLARVEYALISCQKENLTDLMKHFKKLIVTFKKNVNVLNNLRLQIKKTTLNKIFQILSQNYIYREREKVPLTFDDKNNIDEDYFYEKILPKIEGIIFKHEGMFELEVHLPSKEVAMETCRYFETNSRIPVYKLFNVLDIKKISETVVSITNEYFFSYLAEDQFDDNLSNILNKMLIIMRKNYNKLIIKTKSFKDEAFLEDFKSKILQELQNDYFDFNFETTSKIDEIAIFIVEKHKK